MANDTDVAKKQFNIRLEEKLIKDLQKLAKMDNRTPSNYIETLLTEHVASKQSKKK